MKTKNRIENLAKLGDKEAQEILQKQMERDGRAMCAEHGPYTEVEYAKFDLEKLVQNLGKFGFYGWDSWDGFKHRVYTSLRRLRASIRQKHQVEVKWDLDRKTGEGRGYECEVTARIHALSTWERRVYMKFSIKGEGLTSVTFTSAASQYVTLTDITTGTSADTITITIDGTTGTTGFG